MLTCRATSAFVHSSITRPKSSARMSPASLSLRSASSRESHSASGRRPGTTSARAVATVGSRDFSPRDLEVATRSRGVIFCRETRQPLQLPCLRTVPGEQEEPPGRGTRSPGQDNGRMAPGPCVPGHGYGPPSA